MIGFDWKNPARMIFGETNEEAQSIRQKRSPSVSRMTATAGIFFQEKRIPKNPRSLPGEYSTSTAMIRFDRSGVYISR